MIRSLAFGAWLVALVAVPPAPLTALSGAPAEPGATGAAAGLSGWTAVEGPDGGKSLALPSPVEAPASEGFEGDSPVGPRLRQAWAAPAASLERRVERSLAAGLGMGLRELEAPARALLFTGAVAEPEERLARARAAVRLAPGLPAARAALAWALLVDAHDPVGAGLEIARALQAVPRHLEAWLWTRATLLRLLAEAAVAGGLLFLLLAGGALLPRFGRHLLGGLRAMPPASRFAAGAALLLSPAAFGEGLLGLALALTALGFAYGSLLRRLAVGLAATLFVVGMHPLADQAARARTAIVADPVVLAAWAAEKGIPTAAEHARLREKGDEDPLAARALALQARRAGRLGEAWARYRALLDDEDVDGRLLNNAANVALARGSTDEAIALYEKAAEREPAPAIFFNLSQAFGRAVRLDAQDLALAHAQALDAAAVSELSDLFRSHAFAAVVDLPIRVDRLLPRLEAPATAERDAQRFRLRIAPAGADRSPSETAMLFGVLALFGLAVGELLRRIAGEVGEDDLYADIARLLQSRGTDPGERRRRLELLRARQRRVRRMQIALAFVLPGAAGLLAGRPLLGLFGCLCFAGVATLAVEGATGLPDPLAMGLLAPVLGSLALALLGLLYLLQLAFALAVRETA